MESQSGQLPDETWEKIISNFNDPYYLWGRIITLELFVSSAIFNLLKNHPDVLDQAVALIEKHNPAPPKGHGLSADALKNANRGIKDGTLSIASLIRNQGSATRNEDSP